MWPVIVGPGAKEFARQTIGTRELFLLSKTGHGTFSQYAEITTPQGMTLDEKIATAREVLGIEGVPFDHTRATPWWAQPSVILILGIIVLIAGAVFVVRRARRS